MEEEDIDWYTGTQSNNILNKPEASFCYQFYDGYSIRNAIEYLHCTNSNGNFIFSADNITYRQQDGDQAVINDIEIYTHKLLTTDFDGDGDSEIIVGVDISKLRSHTKLIGKKDSVYLTKRKGSTDVEIDRISHSIRAQDQRSVAIIKPISLELFDVELPEYTQGSRHNVSIQSDSYSKTCTGLTSVKGDYVNIRGYDKGIIFIANYNNGSIGQWNSVGEVPFDVNPDTLEQPDHYCLCNLRVRLRLIKAMSKINNLANLSNIRFFIESNRPLKLVSDIGHFGTLTVFISDLTV